MDMKIGPRVLTLQPYGVPLFSGFVVNSTAMLVGTSWVDKVNTRPFSFLLSGLLTHSLTDPLHTIISTDSNIAYWVFEVITSPDLPVKSST